MHHLPPGVQHEPANRVKAIKYAYFFLISVFILRADCSSVNISELYGDVHLKSKILCIETAMLLLVEQVSTPVFPLWSEVLRT